MTLAKQHMHVCYLGYWKTLSMYLAVTTFDYFRITIDLFVTQHVMWQIIDQIMETFYLQISIQ